MIHGGPKRYDEVAERSHEWRISHAASGMPHVAWRISHGASRMAHLACMRSLGTGVRIILPNEQL